MNLDDHIQSHQQQQAARRRIEPRGADCLTFAELSAAALTARQAAHVSACERCATLRQRLLDAEVEVSQGELACGPVAPPRRRLGRAVLIASPLASAACLLLVAWLVAGRPPPGPQGSSAELHERVLQSAGVVDGALRVLGDHTRVDADADRLRAQNQALRAELRRLIDHLEQLLEVARDPAERE